MKKSLNPVYFLFFSALLLLLSTAASADVYKWVDKKGKIQYSDQPPLTGEAQKLRNKSKDSAGATSSSPNTKTPPAPAASVADKELEFRKRKIEKEEAEKRQLAEAEMAKKNKEFCVSLRGDLRSHRDGTRLIRYNEKGERVFLDDKERADSKQDLENRIAKDCK